MHSLRGIAVKWVLLVGVATLGVLLQWQQVASASTPQPTDPRSTVALGKSHSCAISTNDGQVYCWGRGAEGQLGNGTFSSTPTPVLVTAPVTNILELVSGSDHVCALKRDGTVWCWGKNTRGQLGNGNTANSAFPVRAGQLSQIKWIAAGAQHTCALKDDGSTFCWGDNTMGQVDGLLGSSLPTLISTPALVADGTAQPTQAFIHIGSGAPANHTCGIRRDGSVACWGSNLFSQLGSATTTLKLVVTPDIGGAVATATDSPIQVHTSEKFTAIRDGSGRYYWVGLTPVGPFPGFVQAASAGVTATGITSLATTQNFTCVRFVDGKVRCHLSTDPAKVVTGAAALAGFATADPLSFAIYGGYGHACAIQGKGSLYCWGANDSGQVSAAAGGPSNPVAVTGFSVARLGGEQIAVGKGSTCRVYGGKLECWGDNRRGQLGNGTLVASAVPVQVTTGVPIEAVAMGGGHVCALRRDGEVYCWGRNLDAELADGSVQPYESTPKSLSWVVLNNVIALSAGNANTCALKADGSIYCWGANDRFQSGVAGGVQQAFPVKLAGSGTAIAASDYQPSISGYMWLGLGQAHGCAGSSSTTAFALKCWGANLRTERNRPDSPRLGDIGAVIDQSTPFVNPGVVAVAAFSAGTYHSCAIGRLTISRRTTAEVQPRALFCWGSDKWSQSTGLIPTPTAPEEYSILGVGTDIPYLSNGAWSFPWNGTTLKGRLSPPISYNPESVEAGLGTCYTQGTTVKCWGRNADLQVGIGGSAPGADVLTPTTLTVPLNARSLAVGQYHSCAIGSSGEVQCWGRNSEGQVGNGNSGVGTFASTPQPVRGSECRPSVSVAMDDGDPCTRDFCTISLGGPGDPVFTTSFLVGASCNDSLICNGSNQRCAMNGANIICAADPTFTKNDGNACTVDSCDETRGVLHTPGVPAPDGNDCTTDGCNTSTGAATYTARTGSCADLCKFTPTCAGSTCSGTQKAPILDGNPCTIETCNTPAGQISVPRPKGDLGTSELGQGACPSGQQCDGAGNCAAPLTAAEVVADPGPIARADGTTPQDSFYDRMKFLFSGSPQTQTADTVALSLDASRLAVARGVVRALRRNVDLSQTVLPLAGVKVTVIGQPEAGKTYSRADGNFDIALNGGGQVTLQFERAGFLSAQRQVTVVWNDVAHVPDVTLQVPDPSVAIALCGTACATSAPMQSVSGSLVRDATGDRQTTVLFAPSLTGKIVTPACAGNLTSCAVLGNNRTVSVTEYTRSAGQGNDPAQLPLMPAQLPGSSAYTYAVELKVDGVPDTATVDFNGTEVPVYVDNLLGFQVGSVVPSGYYDKAAGVWKAEKNGVVLTITSITGGLADLDLDLTVAGPDSSRYPDYGITDLERQKLATLYSAGKSLWRVPVTHFSTHDLNWSGGPDDCKNGGPCPDDKTGGPLSSVSDPCANQKSGSIIECQNQVLGESLPVAGTPYSLNYRTTTAHGRKFGRMLRVDLPARTQTLPPLASAKRMGFLVTATVGGIYHSFGGISPTATRFEQEWPDDKDVYGRLLEGEQSAVVSVSEEYPLTYKPTERFGFVTFSGQTMATHATQGRTTFFITRSFTTKLTFAPRGKSDLGGWSLSSNHVLDPKSGTLYLGDGTLSQFGFGDLRRETSPLGIGDIQAMAMAPNGDFYFAICESIQRLRQGALTLIAGTQPTAASCFAGTGGSVNPYRGLTMGPDGSLYTTRSWSYQQSDRDQVWRIDPQGSITPFAGKWASPAASAYTPGTYDATKEGGAALAFQFSTLADVSAAADGSVYIADEWTGRVLRVDPAGNITTVAGGGSTPISDTLWSGDAVPATSVNLPRYYTRHVAADLQGNVYFTTADNPTNLSQPGRIILKVRADGKLARVTPSPLSKSFRDIIDIKAGPTGDLYVNFNRDTTNVGSIYSLSNSGEWTALAGDLVPPTTTLNFSAAGPARETPISQGPLSVGKDGRLFFAETAGRRWDNYFGQNGVAYQSAVSSIHLPATTTAESSPVVDPLCAYKVPSKDGLELYCFNKNGLHTKTMHGVTGRTLLTFTYQGIPAGSGKQRLVDIADDSNGHTVLGRNATTGDLLSITGPYQTASRRTTFTTDATTGLLLSMTGPPVEAAPGGAVTQFTYQDGLLTSMTDARNSLFSFGYDAKGLLSTDTDALGNSQTLTRAEVGSRVTVTHTSPLGRSTVYETTPTTSGMTKKTTTPDGSVVFATYSGQSKIDVIHPDGSTRSTTLIPHPNWGMSVPLVGSETVTTALGLTSTTTHQITPLPSFSGGLLVSMEMSHTQAGLTTKTKTEQTVDAALNLVEKSTFTSALGKQVVTTTDGAGRTVKEEVLIVPPVQLATGQVPLVPTFYQYDSFGRVAKVIRGASATDTNRRETTLDYVTSSSTLADYGNLRQATTTQYITGQANSTAVSMSITHDSVGRPLTVTRGSATTGFTWDAAGNMKTLVAPTAKTHRHDYTALGALASYTPPSVSGGGTMDTRYTYNADRQEEAEFQPGGAAVSVTRDPAKGRTTGVAFPGGAFGYQYYPTSTDPSCVASSGCAGGELQKISGIVSTPYAADLSFYYDSLLPTKVVSTDTSGGSIFGEVAWTYNNLFQVTTEGIRARFEATPYSVGYGYDQDGVLSCAQPGAAACDPLNSSALTLKGRPDYDAFASTSIGVSATAISDAHQQNRYGELSHYTAKRGTEVLLDINYEPGAFVRDGLGRVVRRTEQRWLQAAETLRYTYDAEGRVTGAYRVDTAGADIQQVESYSYDLNGNRTSALNVTSGTVQYDEQDRLVRYGSKTFTYTADGSLKTKTESGQTTQYTYDALGNLVKVILPDNSVIDYVVDGLGRRVKRLKNSVLTTEYVYRDSLRLAAIKEGAVVSRFVYGSKSNVPDLMITGTTVYRIISDQLGSPRYVVQVGSSTGSANPPAMSVTYDSFGVMTQTGTRIMPFGFAGGIYDSDTGLVRFGARDYDASIGRWTAKDPIRWEGGQSNLYAYANSDSVNRTDPDGLFAGVDDAIAVTIGVAVIIIIHVGPVIEDLLLPKNPGDNMCPVDQRTDPKDPNKEGEEGAHRKGTRESTRKKHEDAERRRKLDKNGEKGDKRRPYQR